MRLELKTDQNIEIKTTVIVPAFNEEEGLAVVLRKIFERVDPATEVLVVDDGSTDATAEIASGFPCRLVAHDTNRGKGEAMKTGIRQALGDNIIFIDADDTYPAELIPTLAEGLTNHDMVVASRVGGKENIPSFNRVGNAIFRGSIRYLYGFKPYDPLTGFYGIKKEHLEKMELCSGGFGIESEIAIKAARMGLSTLDFPISYGERIGEAKLDGLKDGYRIFRTILGHMGLFNPTITFSLPGAMLILLGLILMTTQLTVVQTPVLNTVLGGVSIIIGFQLSIFGISTHIYASSHKHVKSNILVNFSKHPYTLKTVMFLGLSLALIGLIAIVGVAFSGQTQTLWTVERIGSVTGAWLLVMLGVQMTFASFFLAALSMGGNARDARSPDSVSQTLKETHAERPY